MKGVFNKQDWPCLEIKRACLIFLIRFFITKQRNKWWVKSRQATPFIIYATIKDEHKWYTLGIYRKFITNSLPVWWEFLFEHLTTKDFQGSSHWLLHCTNKSFPIGNPCFGYYDLCWLLTTSLTSLWYSKDIIFTCARETSSDSPLPLPM